MELIKVFFKFSVVGFSGVLVNLAVYSFLLHLKMLYLWAAGISFVVAVTNNFYWNYIWTFRNKGRHKSVERKYLDFFLISLVNFLVNLILLRVFVEVFYLDKIVAQLLAVGLASVLNFAGNFLITFKDKKIK